MKRLSGNAYTLSAESGDVAINAPGEAGGGTISANALEASNVDLAEQFTKMIVTQRAYSAAGKIITTTDEMLQELTKLKRRSEEHTSEHQSRMRTSYAVVR